MFKIVCHGGAGSRGPKYELKNQIVAQAARAGMSTMQAGGDAVTAVVTAVSLMEDSPLLNAGTGSYVQSDGMVRMDASIMDQDLNVGAVIGITNVRNPIQVARLLKDTGLHSILSGELATEFAWSQGIPAYDPRTVEKLELWLELRKKFQHRTNLEMMVKLREMVQNEEALGTVGCVAMDGEGIIAAGTSTGGLKLDMPGRVGDVPLIGCGTYANRFGGISCTGIGEKIIKVCLANTVADFIGQGKTAQEACDLGMREIATVSGRAGLICIDHAGNIGYAFNTEVMTFCQLEEE
ncbi:MAG TPA: isoaspartyl peptidase/L-asparaginase [bacterium]|nr:isoaspartyl peptidase/L-asparaginase [bacterium]